MGSRDEEYRCFPEHDYQIWEKGEADMPALP
jgi:hypothetical protein